MRDGQFAPRHRRLAPLRRSALDRQRDGTVSERAISLHTEHNERGLDDQKTTQTTYRRCLTRLFASSSNRDDVENGSAEPVALGVHHLSDNAKKNEAIFSSQNAMSKLSSSSSSFDQNLLLRGDALWLKHQHSVKIIVDGDIDRKANVALKLSLTERFADRTSGDFLAGTERRVIFLFGRRRRRSGRCHGCWR